MPKYLCETEKIVTVTFIIKAWSHEDAEQKAKKWTQIGFRPDETAREETVNVPKVTEVLHRGA